MSKNYQAFDSHVESWKREMAMPWNCVRLFALALVSELESLPELKTAPMRKVRREYTKALRSEEAQYVFEVVRIILDSDKHRWIAYELIRDHSAAFHSLGRHRLEVIGRGINRRTLTIGEMLVEDHDDMVGKVLS